MRILFLLIGMLLHVGVFAQSEKYYDEFQKLASKDMKLVLRTLSRKTGRNSGLRTVILPRLYTAMVGLRYMPVMRLTMMHITLSCGQRKSLKVI